MFATMLQLKKQEIEIPRLKSLIKTKSHETKKLIYTE